MANISIVTPAYVRDEQEKAWLAECVESVAAQTVACEHVVWNDASPVDLSDLIARYPQVVWRGWDDQKGVCWTRNAAVAISRGPLVLPLDADDRFERQAAEKFLSAWQGAGPHCFVYSNVKLFGAGVEMDRQLPAYDFGLTLKTCVASVSILYPKQAWMETGGYDPAFESGMEDWAYLIALGVKGYCGVHVNEALLWYRSRPGSRRSAMRGQTQEIVNRIREKFAPLYRGERPEGCCAGDGQVRVPSVMRDTRIPVPTAPGAPMAQGQPPGQVLLKYLGEKAGTFSIYIQPTKRYVRVSSRYPMVPVSPGEANWILSRRRDFVSAA